MVWILIMPYSRLFSDSQLASCRQLFKDLNILPLACMFISEIICHIKLHIDKLEQNTEIHNHNKWQKLDLQVQFCRMNVLKKGVVNIGIKLFNELPSQIREVEKMRIFRKELRSYLLQRTFYSVDEYMLCKSEEYLSRCVLWIVFVLRFMNCIFIVW
jgi:hypothetical protein